MIHACTNGSFNQGFLCLFFCGLSKVRFHFIGNKCRELSSDGMMISTKQLWLLKVSERKWDFISHVSVLLCDISFMRLSITRCSKEFIQTEKKKKIANGLVATLKHGYNFHLSNKNNALDKYFLYKCEIYWHSTRKSKLQGHSFSFNITLVFILCLPMAYNNNLVSSYWSLKSSSTVCPHVSHPSLNWLGGIFHWCVRCVQHRWD